MDRNLVRAMLTQHKLNIAKLNTLEERVRMLKKIRADIKQNPCHDYLLYPKSHDPTDPKPSNRSVVSTVELALINKDKAEKLTLQKLDELINDCKRNIYSLQIEVSKLDLAIKNLAERERFIVELRYFDSMKWDDIETNFEIKFGRDKCLSLNRLKQLETFALDTIFKIIN